MPFVVDTKLRMLEGFSSSFEDLVTNLASQQEAKVADSLNNEMKDGRGTPG